MDRNLLFQQLVSLYEYWVILLYRCDSFSYHYLSWITAMAGTNRAHIIFIQLRVRLISILFYLSFLSWSIFIIISPCPSFMRMHNPIIHLFNFNFITSISVSTNYCYNISEALIQSNNLINSPFKQANFNLIN